MSEHKIPRDRQAASNPEGFVIHELETRQSFPVREATDAQLAKHLIAANQQHEQFTHQAMQLIGMAVNAAKASAVIAYEIDRRARTIAVVGNLAGITGLVKQ
jgi:hypothetical protein